MGKRPVKVFGHGYCDSCGSGDIMVLFCRMISQHHVTKGWSNMGTLKPLMASHELAKFVCLRYCGSEDIMILVYHVILQDKLIKGSCDFMGKSVSR